MSPGHCDMGVLGGGKNALNIREGIRSSSRTYPTPVPAFMGRFSSSLLSSLGFTEIDTGGYPICVSWMICCCLLGFWISIGRAQYQPFLYSHRGPVYLCFYIHIFVFCIHSWDHSMNLTCSSCICCACFLLEGLSPHHITKHFRYLKWRYSPV